MSAIVQAGTKVRISTTVGDMILELYDEDKPVTVANFLRYIESGRFQSTFIHRLMPGFVVQGGGYSIVSTGTGYSTSEVETFPPIVNEYSVGKTYSNTLGTIAMAKIPAEDSQGDPIPGGGPDSATSGWFINLGDNASNLDSQNGGFTVFGRVIEGLEVLQSFNTAFVHGSTGGMGVYDASSQLGGAFSDLPLIVGELDVNYLVFTGLEVITPAALTIAGKRKIVTRKKAAKLSGSIAGDIEKVQWRVGKKGKWRAKKTSGRWRIRVGGLEKGRNLVFVRGVASDGKSTKLQKVRIVRR